MKITLNKIKNFFKKFFTLDDSPHHIAAGFALGIFLGIVPGEGVAATLVVASLLKLNRSSALAGVLASNQWGTIAVLPIATLIGGYFFGVTPDSLTQQFNETYHMGLKYFFSMTVFFELALPLMIGFVITAGSIALLSYVGLYFLLKYKKIKPV